MQENITKIRLGLNGAYGRMCRALVDMVCKTNSYDIAFGVDKTLQKNTYSFPVFSCFEDAKTNRCDCDVLVDFSYHTATKSVLNFAIENSIPAVVATTGHTDKEKDYIVKAGEQIPIFFANNTSFGTYIFAMLAKTAATLLDDSFDIEILETHHRIKADAPSGTSLALANAIADAKRQAYGAEYTITTSHSQKRDKSQIGISSIRGGTVVGKHEIDFLGDNERLIMIHEAENTNVYIQGALKAAEFLTHKQKGVYSMSDIIKMPKLK